MFLTDHRDGMYLKKTVHTNVLLYFNKPEYIYVIYIDKVENVLATTSHRIPQGHKQPIIN